MASDNDNKPARLEHCGGDMTDLSTIYEQTKCDDRCFKRGGEKGVVRVSAGYLILIKREEERRNFTI